MLRRADERLLRRIRTRRGRMREGVVVLEGPRAIETAVRHGADILLTARETGATLPPGLESLLAGRRIGGSRAEVPVGGLAGFARTAHPQGILAIAREPDAGWPPPSLAACQGRGVLVLDRIRDPGNAGALVRSAAALGTERVIALDGTVDLWSAKAVRAAAGLSFALPLHRARWRELDRWMASRGVVLVVADPRGRDIREFGLPLRSPSAAGGGVPGLRDAGADWALLVGNEARGPRPEATGASTARVAIPLRPGVESLNAALAGALLLWELGPGRARRPEGGGRTPPGHREPRPPLA
ncbi:MAG: RNA methyltransferase [Gammaproteobacteria bacterium]|nr:RNA methyltransferase [Gammaproteobacteria bacterium]